MPAGDSDPAQNAVLLAVMAPAGRYDALAAAAAACSIAVLAASFSFSISAS